MKFETIKNNKCCIVLITHKEFNSLDEDEIFSLKNCIKIFGERGNICLVLPKSVNTKQYLNLYKEFDILQLDNYHFTSHENYCKMMETSEFYKEFIEFTNIFIYQTDCIAFRDDLEKYCDMRYSYIGSGWPDSWTNIIIHNKNFTNHKNFKLNTPMYGCGGFNLRNIKRCIELCNLYNIKDELYYINNDDDIFFLYYLEPEEIMNGTLNSEFGVDQVLENYMWYFDSKRLPMGGHQLLLPYIKNRNLNIISNFINLKNLI